MNDEIKNIMDLKFEEEKKKEQEAQNQNNIFDDKDSLVRELEGEEVVRTSESEFLLPKKEKSVETEAPKVKKQKEPKEEKEPKQPKTRQPKTIARRSLERAICWIIVLVLSLFFGGDAIWQFVEKLLDFIDATSDDALEATRLFFVALAYIFEAILFTFFIIYSIIKMIINLKPWVAYRKETEGDRYDVKISKARTAEKKLIGKLDAFDVKKQPAQYAGVDKKKELKAIEDNISALEKKLEKVKEKELKKQ